jgi:hypothetical protein
MRYLLIPVLLLLMPGYALCATGKVTDDIRVVIDVSGSINGWFYHSQNPNNPL